MGLYNKYILPNAVDWACRIKPHMRQREKIIPLATGHVLEIGIGSGLNLPFYHRENVTQLTAIDPSREMWNQRAVNTLELPFGVEFIEACAEAIPLDDRSIDTVVITYTLCTIIDAKKALQEMRRVLKPNGKLIFCEHGKAPDRGIQRVQNMINPFWKRIAGGCNLNRDIPQFIENNGFKVTQLETMYAFGWKPASFNYWGTAEPYNTHPSDCLGNSLNLSYPKR